MPLRGSGQRLDRAGGRVSGHKCPLTARELQIVGLVAQGQTNVMIADTLRLSPLTVKSHLHRILGRIGAGDRAHATYICLREGWIE